MKKTKGLFIVLLILFITIISIGKVNAHSVELDPKSLISFPMVIYGGEGNISIRSSETGYSLYYQAVEISNTVFAQLEKIKEDGESALENIDTQLDTLKAELNNLEEIYDEALDVYKEKRDNGVTGSELENAETAYKNARTNYQNKATEYNNKVEEYNNKVKEVNNNLAKLTPSYVDSNWKKTEDRSFSVDLTQFSGKKSFVIWAKLVSSNGTTSYDTQIYSMSGTKKEINVQSISLDKTEISLKEGSSYTLIPTITPTDATNKTIKWTSSNEKVAKVENGKVTAIAEGTATITATTSDGNYTATCKVTVSKKDATVTEIKVKSIKLDKNEISLKKGDSYTLKTTITPNNATNKSVTWSSSNEKVAKVEGGKVTAIAEGTATITITTKDGNYTDTCKVTVSKEEVKQDTTTAKGEIPQTGDLFYKIIFAIAVISIIGIIMYKKVKYLNFK